MMTRVLVVDNEVLIADDLCNTLHDLGYEPLPPAFDYLSAIEALQSQSIDIAILDIQLGGKKSGLDIGAFISKNLDIPFIYLSSHSDQKTLDLAKGTMPYAYLVKPFEASEVRTSLEIALNNHSRYRKKVDAPDEDNLNLDLTPMEKVVARYVAEKKSTKQIAQSLSISVSTVKNHRHNICVKLKLPAGTHSLLKWAMENKQLLN